MAVGRRQGEHDRPRDSFGELQDFLGRTAAEEDERPSMRQAAAAEWMAKAAVYLNAALRAAQVPHKVWLEQPENLPTAIARKPSPRSAVAPLLKKSQLFK